MILNIEKNCRFENFRRICSDYVLIPDSWPEKKLRNKIKHLEKHFKAVGGYLLILHGRKFQSPPPPPEIIPLCLESITALTIGREKLQIQNILRIRKVVNFFIRFFECLGIMRRTITFPSPPPPPTIIGGLKGQYGRGD